LDISVKDEVLMENDTSAENKDFGGEDLREEDFGGEDLREEDFGE
jgi:hypothetical protein